MNRRKQFESVCVLVLLFLLAHATPLLAQESQRQLRGELVSGFSGFGLNNDSVDGPYVGLNADLLGYWKDPRILEYEVQPNLRSGFEWAGPMSGPTTNGIASNATFLGGSNMPANFYFSRQYIPSPDFGRLTTDSLGISQLQQTYGFDWNTRFKHMPQINFHFFDGSSSQEFPVELGGPVSNGSRDFRVDIQQVVAKWNLSGVVNRDTSRAQAMSFLAHGATDDESRSGTNSYSFAASRPLPFRSQLILTAQRSDTALDIGSVNTKGDYSRLGGSLSTRWTNRFTTNFDTNYVSSFADFARAQILQGGGTGLPADNPLLGTTSGTLSYNGGFSFIVLDGLTLNGGVGATSVLDSENLPIGNSKNFTGGLNYLHKLYGGSLSAGYTVTDWKADAAQGDVSTTVPVHAEDSLTHSTYVGYTHDLPLHLQMSARASYSNQHIDYVYTDTLETRGINFDLARKVANWDMRARVNLSEQSQDYPAHRTYSYNSYGFSATSKKLQLSVSELTNNSLAYQFGNGVIIVPGNPGGIPGLPALALTTGNTFTANATYTPDRHWTIRGMYFTGDRTTVAADTIKIFAHGYDFKLDYAFRKVHFAGGYDKTSQTYEHATSAGYRANYFYVEVRREFRLF